MQWLRERIRRWLGVEPEPCATCINRLDALSLEALLKNNPEALAKGIRHAHMRGFL